MIGNETIKYNFVYMQFVVYVCPILNMCVACRNGAENLAYNMCGEYVCYN